MQRDAIFTTPPVWRELIDRLPWPLVLLNDDDHVQYVNQQAILLFGTQIEDCGLMSLMASELDGQLFKAYRAGQSAHVTLRLLRLENANSVPFEAVLTKIPSSQFGVDAIIVKPAAEDADKSPSQTDPLTGLPNRALILEQINRSLQLQSPTHTRMGVLFIDLDRFKFINDTYGHAAGDAVLKEVARRLRSCVRDADIVGRLGGDEFVAILPYLRVPQDAAIVAERILDACSRPIEVSNQQFYTVSCSIGLAVWPDDAPTAETLLHSADVAMYAAKRSGRDSFRFFDNELNDQQASRVTLESDLRKALSGNQFVLHYQPQLHMQTGQIIGAEALIRWQHPEKGLIPPGMFIPVAEETNLVTPIGEWVLMTACQAAKRWLRNGRPMKVAVNISARHFEGRLVEDVQQALARSQLPPYLLEIEITESFMVRDIDRAVEVLNALKEIGVLLALDDFGTGFSSLNYLSRFPLDVLKIDRSFVGGEQGPEQRIIRTILSVAREFKLQTLAEGVETDEQREILAELGCDQWQGFLKSRPVPEQEWLQLLECEPLIF